MSNTFKIPQALYTRIRQDLARPHSFAYERVGFVFARPAGKGQVIVATGYDPVEDANYIQDDYVGAKINSTAIRKAMQRCLDTGEAIVHVHVHDHDGPPAFSEVDECSLAEMVPAFQKLCPSVPHGALLLSRDNGIAAMWTKLNQAPVVSECVTVVGCPMAIWRNQNV